MNWKESGRQNHDLISDTFAAIFLGVLKKITKKEKSLGQVSRDLKPVLPGYEAGVLNIEL